MFPHFPQADELDCARATDQQIFLTEKWISPNLDTICAGLKKIRQRIDLKFERARDSGEQKQNDHLAGLTNLADYPYGYCDRIRDIVWNSVHYNINHSKVSSRHFGAVSNFLSEGGIFKKIWGELSYGPYFQNAIQLGSFYVDAANDTVDIRKPKLEIKPLAEANFRNIESFERYFEIANSYYDWDVYPNHYFSRLAPFFPGIAIHREKNILLICDVPRPLLYKNLQSQGELASRFMYQSSYAKKTLPEFAAKNLVGYLNNERSVEIETFLNKNPKVTTMAHEILSIENPDKAFRNVKHWLSQNRPLLHYTNAVAGLDMFRKHLDRTLRLYSLNATK